ncbi:hypothetical protein [Streptomyces sp. NPDC020996]|uniref:hypothetical protein n=1 Tax=Streptomyces sp. NPDC020996 TaxID=3154791 RepID=UPI0033EF8072
MPGPVDCGGAVNAAGLALALHDIGIDDVLLYDGSLAEWRADPAPPLLVGPEDDDVRAPAGRGPGLT